MRLINVGRVSLNLMLILMCLSIASAQDTHDSSPEGIEPLLEVRTETTLYSGPGVTYRALGELDGNETLDLLARNRIGNWVELRVQDEDDADTMLEGWALTGALTLDETIHFSDVQVD